MGVQLMHAVLTEMDGKLNRPGLESMGFDLQSDKVIYGMGAFPVIRLGLSDAAALRATILRGLSRHEAHDSDLKLEPDDTTRAQAATEAHVTWKVENVEDSSGTEQAHKGDPHWQSAE